MKIQNIPSADRRWCFHARILVALLVMTTTGFAASIPPSIPIWPEGVPGKQVNGGHERDANAHVYNVQNPSITPFVAPAAKANGTAVIICPGGGYADLSIVKEGYAVAHWFNSLGVTAFVLKYRLKQYGQPAPLEDGLRAVRYVRSHAKEWNIDPNRLGMIGFSAGGHVASSVATHFENAPDPKNPAYAKISARPDFLILAYPVVTMKKPYVHMGSRELLLGKDPSPALIEQYSNEDQVTPQTPPTFLVAGGTDTTVPAENSVNFFLALRRNHVPAEIHIFEKGPHGFGLNKHEGPISQWPQLCAEWMQVNGWIGKK